MYCGGCIFVDHASSHVHVEFQSHLTTHETLKANDLKSRYLERLAERKSELQRLCAVTGWHYGLHHTSASAQSALLWLYSALDTRVGAAA